MRVLSAAGAPRLVVLSLGAGVQSTTLALMAERGEIERPDCAIFADTGWESAAVYEQLRKLRAALSYPVHVVSAGNLRADVMKKAAGVPGRVASVPWFSAGGGMLPRQCTAEYKVAPINAAMRALLGAGSRRLRVGAAEVWIGISTDEAVRMRPARVAWQTNRWPLIERAMSRVDCLRWLERAGWTAPKSSCIGCPYHSNAMWREIRDTDPKAWADAVEVDRAIRDGGNLSGIRARTYMHRSLRPLDEVDLSTPADHGQRDLFGEECEGICGV